MTKDYQKYVKEKLWKEFEEHCKMNSLDFYSCGCVLTAHLVMESLMQHEKYKDEKIGEACIRADKVTPKEAWKSAMEQTSYHSGFSATCTAQIIVRFSPRGEEFKEWWKKEHE